MKRLTEKYNDCYEPSLCLGCDGECRECNAMQNSANKLAAYENTGLEPKEIKENKKTINDLARIICSKNDEIEKLKCQLAEYKRRLENENGNNTDYIKNSK